MGKFLLYLLKIKNSVKNGTCPYCYTTNELNEVDFSGGEHNKIKNHEISIANFTFNWLFFMVKAKYLESRISKLFLFPKNLYSNNRKRFIVSYCKSMGYSFGKLSDR